MKTWANVLLGVWLVALGALSLVRIEIPAAATILDLLAIAAGALLLVAHRGVRGISGLGRPLLGVWLIATGLIPLAGIRFPAASVILAVVAVAAGALILLSR